MLTFILLAQERWRSVLQLDGAAHTVLRETGAADSARIQYPLPTALQLMATCIHLWFCCVTESKNRLCT